VRLGLVTEAFADRSLADLLDWLEREAPEITDLEIDSGGYAPQAHCDRATLLADPEARRRWRGQIEDRGLRIGALNAWGLPLSVLRAEGQESAVDLAGRVDRVRPDPVLRRPCHPPWPGCQRRPRLRGDPA
jgi:sugar phosphate isomerase/epimerase